MWNSVKEGFVLNIISLVISLGSVGMAVWTLMSTQFRAGIDDLFLVLTCLFLAIVFAIGPIQMVLRTWRLKKLGKGKSETPASAEQSAPTVEKQKAAADK
jgi:hypothetical protein